MTTPFNNKDSEKPDIDKSCANAIAEEHSLSRFAHNYAAEIEAELIARLCEQDKLRRSEARYRDFFENAKEAIYVHDLSGHYLMVNRAGEELLGYAREELLQMTVFDVVPAS